jgi:hypothetical protein
VKLHYTSTDCFSFVLFYGFPRLVFFFQIRLETCLALPSLLAGPASSSASQTRAGLAWTPEVLHGHVERVVPILLKLFRDGTVPRSDVAAILVALRPLGVQALMDIVSDEHASRAELRWTAVTALGQLDLESPQIPAVRFFNFVFASTLLFLTFGITFAQHI